MTTNRSTMGTRFVNRQMTLVDAVPIMVLDLEGALLRIGRGDVVDQLRKVSLERWTYEEAEERFRTEAILNCSVTSYRFDDAARRLILEEAGRTFWT